MPINLEKFALLFLSVLDSKLKNSLSVFLTFIVTDKYRHFQVCVLDFQLYSHCVDFIDSMYSIYKRICWFYGL